MAEQDPQHDPQQNARQPAPDASQGDIDAWRDQPDYRQDLDREFDRQDWLPEYNDPERSRGWGGGYGAQGFVREWQRSSNRYGPFDRDWDRSFDMNDWDRGRTWLRHTRPWERGNGAQGSLEEWERRFEWEEPNRS